MNFPNTTSLALSLVVLSLFTSDAGSAENIAQQQQVGQSVIVKPESQSAFKGMLYSVWSSLLALNPQSQPEMKGGEAIATIGVRGARLSPAMSAQAQDTGSQAKHDNEEFERYMHAQQLAERGELEKAAVEFEAFTVSYKHSELRSNALFALGISQNALGDIESSKWTLLDFVDEYPQHPLVADAEMVLEEIEITELLE